MKASNSIDTKLAAVWQQLLDHHPNHESNFFAMCENAFMGANSLLLIRLGISTSEQIGISVDVSGLLQNPKFADMLSYIDGNYIEEKEITQLPQYDHKCQFSGTSVPLTIFPDINPTTTMTQLIWLES